MSIDTLSGLGMSDLSQELQKLIREARGGAQDPDEFASSIIKKDDADGDGLLSLAETPLEEGQFNSIDADGDGFLSEEELSADFQNHKNESMGRINMEMQGMDPAAMAAHLIEQDDADGDGLLSLDETPLDEDTFNSIDLDGDGMLSAEELSADMEAHMAGAQGAMGASQGTESAGSAASGPGSGSGSGEEEYDEYDLNKDGQVTYDELLQAFQQGDSSLADLFRTLGGKTSSLTQRLAMKAYEAQAI